MSRYIDDLIKDFERQRQELVNQHGEDDSFVVCIDTVVIPTIIRITNEKNGMNALKTDMQEVKHGKRQKEEKHI